jgi:hypothetical protein
MGGAIVEVPGGGQYLMSSVNVGHGRASNGGMAIRDLDDVLTYLLGTFVWLLSMFLNEVFL